MDLLAIQNYNYLGQEARTAQCSVLVGDVMHKMQYFTNIHIAFIHFLLNFSILTLNDLEQTFKLQRLCVCLLQTWPIPHAVSVRLSVCHVRGFCQNDLSYHILGLFSPLGSQTILVYPYSTSWRYSDGDPSNRGVKCR